MINTDDLLLIYRHAKALVKVLEKVLLDQMVIRCTGCGHKHRAGDPHVTEHTIVLERRTGVKLEALNDKNNDNRS